MILKDLTATFGCLNHASLALEDGLNVIQAPNESGKSTWLAFLRTMLYGLPSRERGPLAEKNRYAPWSGAAMQGRVALTDGDRTLILTREAAPGGVPLGRFSAVYAGTATQVAGMTGQNAGELLTGVPRSVFERSAFIRQGSLAVDQDAELEKRIAALLSAGEEDVSYSETEKRLRAALNQRRHHKTGVLPRMEEELDQLRGQLSQLRALRSQADEARAALRSAEAARRSAEEKLARCDQLARRDAAQARRSAREALERAEQEAARLRDALAQAHLPPAEQLMQIKYNAANLLTTQVSMNHVQAQAEAAKKQADEAKAAVDASPFAPDDPEQAAEKVRALQETYERQMHHAAPGMPLIVLLTLAALALLAGAVYAFHLPWSLVSAGAAVPVMLALLRGRSRRRARAQAAAALEPYGADTAQALDPMLIHYNNVYRRWMEQKEAEAQVNASWQNFYQTCKRLSSEILAETSAFCPELENVHDIAPLLDQGLRQWKRLQALEQQAAQLRGRCEGLEAGGHADEAEPLSAAPEPPAESRSDLEALRDESLRRQEALRSRIDRAEGEMAALGDPIALQARLEELEAARCAAQEEYDAIALALDALSSANDALQLRFSPALGRRAGEIFESLTGGRYRRVLLDKQLNAAAEGADAMARSAALLSQGAADQLYLSVRLAICDLVLPAEKAVPLILDDTLANFDDARCAAALDWLAQAARERQILLFTCQSREAVYLQNRENVHIISLCEENRR